MGNSVEAKVDASRINLKLDELPDVARAALADKIYLLGGELADLARARAESLLTVRGGGFLRSIKFRYRDRKESLTGTIGAYAKTASLFEWGGKTGAHQILPDKAKALMLPGGKFVARVQHPGGHYKRLEIIHGAFTPMKPEVIAQLEAAVNEAAEHASDN
jgi:hypothetical protein